MNHFYKDIVGWCDYEDIYRMAVQLSEGESYFLETGTANGQSTAFMLVEIANSDKPIHFTSIDIFANEGQKERVVELFKDFQNFNLIEGNALDFESDKKFDFIFLDDEHSYEHLLKELHKYWEMLSDGGYIGSHDYLNPGYPGVKEAVHEFADEKKISIEIIGISVIMKKG
jgi:predicted O-methyltransferase YrrM